MRKFKPHRVLGVFRFTLKASSEIVAVPYDSLICGCMIPDSKEVLGFADGEDGIERQKIILSGFFRYGGSKICLAHKAFGIEGIEDVRYLLKGQRTFLWDFPEFLPLPSKKDIIHVGPVLWKHWPYDEIDIETIVNDKYPLAVIAFGTCTLHVGVIERITRILIELGYSVLLAAGGKRKF
jgi:hypothetical protein